MTVRVLTAVFALLAISASEHAASEGVLVSFKLDPHLTSGMFMGERWVSPQVFHSTMQPGRRASVIIRAIATGPQGKTPEQAPQWEVANTDHVTISRAGSDTVNLTVKGVGESTVAVSIGDEATILIATSIYDEKSATTKVTITQVKQARNVEPRPQIQ